MDIFRENEIHNAQEAYLHSFKTIPPLQLRAHALPERRGKDQFQWRDDGANDIGDDHTSSHFIHEHHPCNLSLPQTTEEMWHPEERQDQHSINWMPRDRTTEGDVIASNPVESRDTDPTEAFKAVVNGFQYKRRRVSAAQRPPEENGRFAVHRSETFQ